MLKLDNKRKSKEENWKEMSNLGHAGHQSAVIVVLLDIIDTSAVVIDSLYRRIVKYGGGCCCCCLSRQRIHRIRRIRRIRRRSVVGAVRWWITLSVLRVLVMQLALSLACLELSCVLVHENISTLLSASSKSYFPSLSFQGQCVRRARLPVI